RVQAVDHSLAVRVLTDIADEHDSNTPIQDRVWSIVTRSFQAEPDKYSGAVYLGGDVAPKCNTAAVTYTLFRWLSIDYSDPQSNARHRSLLYGRLGNCIRPNQLAGWAQVPTGELIGLLEQDACQDTKHVVRAMTEEAHI